MGKAEAKLLVKKAIEAGKGLSPQERVMKAVPEMGYLLERPDARAALSDAALALVEYVHQLGAAGAQSLPTATARQLVEDLQQLRRDL